MLVESEGDADPQIESTRDRREIQCRERLAVHRLTAALRCGQDRLIQQRDDAVRDEERDDHRDDDAKRGDHQTPT